MIRISAPTTPTSRSRRARAKSSSAGFSLIEILIVISLMALVMSVAIPNIGVAIRVNLDNSARELANTIRATHDESVLTGQVHRMAIDLDKREYWVEAGARTHLLLTPEQEEEERRLDEKRTEEERKARKEPFSLARAVTRKKLRLPKGVQFTDVETSRSPEPVQGGLAYAHFFPHGFSERLIIRLKDDFERELTLSVNSVTGKSTLLQGYVKEVD